MALRSRFPLSPVDRPRFALIASFFRHIRRMPPGDKAIASVLALAFLVSVFIGLIALERTHLVKVPAYGGSLTEGVLGRPRFANPLLALSDADRDVAALTYAGLMGTDADGTLVPVLASQYELSEDGKVYTFTLRNDLTFSDGTPLTADDVVFTVTKAQDPGLKSPEYANWANVQVEAVDAHTVRFTLPQAYAPFLEDATLGILPARLWRNVSDSEFPFSPLMEKPVGAGPFKVTQVVRDTDGLIKEYRLTAFHAFAPGRPYLDGIRLKFYGDSEELAAALASGRIESAYGIATPDALRASYARVFGVFFNQNEQPVLKNTEVREALSVAIDRQRIIDETLGGHGTPLTGPLPPDGLLAESVGMGTNGADVYTTKEERLTAARAVLEDDDWSFDIEKGWMSGTTEMPTITIRTSNVPELKLAASLIQEDWRALGIPTDVVLYEPGDLVQEVIRPRAYDALLFGEVIGRSRDLYAFWHSSQTEAPGLNIALYSDPATDLLLSRARAESDPLAAAKDIESASARIASSYPAAFTHAPDFLYAVPKDLEGVVLREVTSPSDRFASVSSWHRYSEYIWPFLVSSK